MSNDICSTTDLHVDECDCSRHRPAAPSAPGLYPDLDEAVYHADKLSLSSTGARKLLEVPPAQWIYDRDNPDTEAAEPNEALELGSAVHTLTLGAGPEVVPIMAKDWRTKGAQQQRTEARAAGKIPLLIAKYKRAKTMADNLRHHPRLARALEQGTPELSGYWRDPETGLMCRLRTDCLYTAPSGAVLAIDVKTADTADPAAFVKSVITYGYDQQDDWYTTGLEILLGVRSPAFLFAIVAKKPPHLVSIVELPPEWLERGRRRNRQALDIYARCLESGHWPGFGDDIHHPDMPYWLVKQEEYAQ